MVCLLRTKSISSEYKTVCHLCNTQPIHLELVVHPLGHTAGSAFLWHNLFQLDFFHVPDYNHYISIQEGDDHYDKRNYDAHNAIQRIDRPERISMFSVRCLCTLLCRGSFYAHFKGKEQKA